jgi:hypothetical protein
LTFRDLSPTKAWAICPPTTSVRQQILNEI